MIRLKKDGTPRKKDGYPPKEHDEELILKLSSILCTNKEIANICGCSEDTLERRYMHVLEKGRSNGRMSLRRRQYEIAMEGNPTILIWLGKNYLSQKEPKAVDESTAQVTEIDIKLHPKAIPNETSN